MQVQYLAVFVCAILSLVVGSIWYGPLFGKKWMEIVGATAMDETRRKEMQKKAMPLYLIQFLLTLFQVWVLARLIGGSYDALQKAVWIWAAFIMPTIAGSSMWNNDSAKISWARFFIQAGYQIVVFVLFGIILGMWK